MKSRIPQTPSQDTYLWKLNNEAVIKTMAAEFNRKWDAPGFYIIDPDSGVVNFPELIDVASSLCFVIGLSFSLNSFTGSRQGISPTVKAFRLLLDEYPQYCVDLAFQYLVTSGFFSPTS